MEGGEGGGARDGVRYSYISFIIICLTLSTNNDIAHNQEYPSPVPRSPYIIPRIEADDCRSFRFNVWCVSSLLYEYRNIVEVVFFDDAEKSLVSSKFSAMIVEVTLVRRFFVISVRSLSSHIDQTKVITLCPINRFMMMR